MTVDGVPLTSDGQARLLVKVARMYHERGIRQSDIALALHISQAKVSRLLKRAVEVGIVRTVVVSGSVVNAELEEALEERYGLLEAIVVDAHSEDERDIVAALGSAAAQHLETTLSGSDRIGISSWSQTLLAMTQRLRPFKVPAAVEVVQLVGGIGVPAVQAKAQRLIGDLARLLAAEPVLVQAPALVASAEVRDALMADAALATVRERWRQLTLALVGIGSLEPSPLLAESGNAFPDADLRRLLEAGAVGDVCNHFFTADGSLVAGDLDARIVAVPAEDFRTIPRRVGIAGGDRKHEAIRAAVVGGWVNVLVTDVTTATALTAG